VRQMGEFFRKLSMLFRRDRFRSELDEEMAFHRAQAEREFVSGGMTAKAARLAAKRQFGNAERLKEQSHEVIGFRFETVAQDLRYAARQLLLNPGFTVVITLTLALEHRGQQRHLQRDRRGAAQAASLSRTGSPACASISPTIRLSSVSAQPLGFSRLQLAQHFVRIARGVHAFRLPAIRIGRACALNGFNITSRILSYLGLKPKLGREFDAASGVPGSASQVILSDGLWRTRFKADPNTGPQDHARHAALHRRGVMPPGTDAPR
jgi:macrolide transport system ATP-binding/permease protein